MRHARRMAPRRAQRGAARKGLRASLPRASKYARRLSCERAGPTARAAAQAEGRVHPHEDHGGGPSRPELHKSATLNGAPSAGAEDAAASSASNAAIHFFQTAFLAGTGPHSRSTRASTCVARQMGPSVPACLHAQDAMLNRARPSARLSHPTPLSQRGRGGNTPRATLTHTLMHTNVRCRV